MKRQLRFTRDQLKEELTLLKASHYKGAPGVRFYQSALPGPCLGITINTHGNEPSGLAVARYLRLYAPLDTILRRGSVMIVVNNLKAAEKYFNAKNLKEKRGARFCDINMNRLPIATMRLPSSKAYEIKRARELRAIWDAFDAALDIHSTTLPSKPMIIACNGFNKNLVKGFPITTIITNIDQVQVGKPAALFYGKGKIPTVEIEAGCHEGPSSYRTAITAALILMNNLGLIKIKIPKHPKTQVVYRVYDSVLFPHDGFRLKKIFKNFEKISAGQTLATYRNEKIIASRDGYTLFCAGRKAKDINEEVLFLAEKA